MSSDATAASADGGPQRHLVPVPQPDGDDSAVSLHSQTDQAVAAPAPAPAPQFQAGDDYFDDNDSGFGDDDGASDTVTLASSVFNYEYENGRRYHAYRAGKYPMPNDEAEQDRLDFQHHIYLLLNGGTLYRAPLPARMERALDVGCGTGKWAIDFADMHPDTNVVATDLSVIQPQWVPPNLQFEIDDAEENWEYHTPFDYIHIRSMGGSISDWPRLLQQAYQHLRPGGWIEVTDFETWASTDDNSLPETSSYQEFQVRLSEAARLFGKEMNVSPHYLRFVQDTGFVNVTEQKTKAPLSPWPQDKYQRAIGMYVNAQMLASIEPYSLALFTRVLKWDADRIQALFAGVRKDLHNLNYHMYSVV